MDTRWHLKQEASGKRIHNILQECDTNVSTSIDCKETDKEIRTEYEKSNIG